MGAGAPYGSQELTPHGLHEHQGKQQRVTRERQAEGGGAVQQRSPSPLTTDGEEEAFHTPIRSVLVTAAPLMWLPIPRLLTPNSQS